MVQIREHYEQDLLSFLTGNRRSWSSTMNFFNAWTSCFPGPLSKYRKVRSVFMAAISSPPPPFRSEDGKAGLSIVS